MPDYSDTTPAYVQIADDLRGQIRAGAYDDAEGKLPSNKDLSEKYGVADGTIRSALELLRSEGTVETRSTRGTYATGKPAADRARLNLQTVGEQLAELEERTADYPDLRARVDLLEANLMDLYSRLGYEYPHGGQHDNGKKAAARRGRGRR